MTISNTSQSARQSRVGKRPVEVPSSVQVSIRESLVSVKGPKGAIERRIPEAVKVEQQGSTLLVRAARSESDRVPQYQGLVRALLRNMIEGVATGYSVSLDLYGVGYRAELSGQALTLNLGLSHTVKVTLPQGVQGRVETIDEAGQKRPRLHLSSHDKELLGQVAARIRSYRPPEPYKGKGIRYTGERIREKAGKAGGKGKK